MGCNIFEVKTRKNPHFTILYIIYFYLEFHNYKKQNVLLGLPAKIWMIH